MDKGWTLIGEVSLPKNLWGFAIMTAICLINGLPSKKLGLQSPIEVVEKCFTYHKTQEWPTAKGVWLCMLHSHPQYGN